MQHEERWTQIEDWPYEVSTHGRVRRMPGENSPSGRVLRQQVYARVPMCDRSRKTKGLVHQLVARAFLGPMPTPQHTEINHINGVTTDNRIENLEWTTRRESQLHAIDTGLSAGRGEDHPRAKITDEKVSEIRRSYTGAWGEQGRLGKKYGITQVSVSKIIARETWTHLDDDDPSNIRTATRGNLTDDQLTEIRERYTGKRGEKAHLAREYGVTQTHIGRILKASEPQRPEEKHARKLDVTKVRAMREAYATGESMRKIAKRHDVTRQTARDVVTGRTWQDVPQHVAPNGRPHNADE